MNNPFTHSNTRIIVLYGLIFAVCAIFILRLFYIQVIRHGYYDAQAQSSQLKRYEIPAERGTINAFDGSEKVPLVLNEQRYNIVADPEIITDKEETALRVADVLKVNKEDVLKSLVRESRYEILAKKQTKEIKMQIEKLMADGDIIGVFAELIVQRVYPNGALASQVLGFVNDDGEGNYGIEEALNAELSGTPGRVKALTDQNGIPLLANGENIQEDPIDGKDVTLTIDVAMQRQVEQLLKQGLDKAKSKSGSVIVVDVNTGAIKAMANYPSYDPADFARIEDTLLFKNASVGSVLEPGSIMKTLTTAAALDSGSVSPNQTYYDPSFYTIDGATVRNVEEDGGAATRSVADILRFSLNTGATWLLMQMGDGELNEKGRTVWNDYMINRYGLGKITGIEQGFEESGYVPDPVEGFGLNIQYANTAFGQGVTTTPLQMAMAVTSVVNGGTYYKPTLVAGYTNPDGVFIENKPVVVSDSVVSDIVSSKVVEFMQGAIAGNNLIRPVLREGYTIGGKTGTAEVARPEGGYYEDRFNGTYVGFVGGDKPEYVIISRVNEPGISGYAGTTAAAPIFMAITNMLIDNFSIEAKTGQ
jgi:stage V sporulation protein D (sporulation-specific penicillin-binding protein)